MPWTRADLLSRLADLGIATTTRDHRPVFTVAEGDDVAAAIPGGHSKNLFLKDKKGRLFLISAEARATIDLKTVSPKIGASGRVSFAGPDLLMDLLGVIPGSVTPFGVVNDGDARVTVVLDAGLMRHPILNFHPLRNDATTSIGRDDLVRFLTATGHPPRIVAVAEPPIPPADG
jgi:Ala-tRNA(Pro) deacylase